MTLHIGEAAPWFVAETSSNPTFAVHSVAGRFVLLGFIPDAAEREKALGLFAARRAKFDDVNLCAFMIVRDPESIEQARDALPGLRFMRDRSGDITLAPAPYWIFVPGRNPHGGNATTHGSANEYDQHVPLIFLGAPFAPGRVSDAATPADLAPTLAATVGLPYDGIEGRALAAAVRK